MDKDVGAALHRVSAHEADAKMIEKMARKTSVEELRIDFNTGAAVFLFTAQAAGWTIHVVSP